MVEIASEDTFEIMIPKLDSVALNLVEGKRVATIEGEHFDSWKKPKVVFNNEIKNLSCKVQSCSDNVIDCSRNKAVVSRVYTLKVLVGKVLKGQIVVDISVP